MRAPGPGEVLVRVKASALNFRDLMILNGWLPYPATPGLVPLSDGAGEIIETGEGVTRFAVGNRVVGSFNPTWYGGRLRKHLPLYGTSLDGWLTSHKIVSADALALVPEAMSLEEAATLPCAGVTALSALSGITPGDVVLTQGSGGVSLFAIQLAKLSGARVVATTTSPGKAEKLKALGASHVIDVGATPEWARELRALTNGAGADRIVEVGGPASMAQSMAAVALGGQVSIVGALSAGPQQPGIDFMRLFMSQARYECIGVGSRSDLEDLLRVSELHRLRPIVDSTFLFSEVDKAFGRLAGRSVFGKVIITH
ncbi:zinc-dependent alcohol dehydrogenase family protein [Ensifer adhaerens]|uniref:zinc-dependent alcohol dehydrogenase family protein n=1 Tax=Ensifer adhaerens TaxID=106592 RepID=UPI0022AA53ED|nr:NAD(P)-dependent alcohol dehydrogenase [Ensifer adhaerens]